MILSGLNFRAMYSGLTQSVPTSKIVFLSRLVFPSVAKASSISDNSSNASVYVAKSFLRVSSSSSHSINLSIKSLFSHDISAPSMLSYIAIEGLTLTAFLSFKKLLMVHT